MKRAWLFAAALVALGVLGAGVFYWQLQQRSTAVHAPASTPQASIAVESAAPSTPAAASVSQVKHPIETPIVSESAPPPLDVESTLVELFGRKTVLSMFQLQDFPRRVVATVDNLGRSHAPSRLWPVNPTEGRFVVDAHADVQSINADNGLRYTPFVLLIETVNMHQAVAAYARLYPLFQQAYEDIGYPKLYFNDRLVDVIDQLLSTPDPKRPLNIHIPPINGPVQPARPWVLYEFDDATLQSLSAGQKLLLRMGPINERRVKTKLAEIRRLVAAEPLPR